MGSKDDIREKCVKGFTSIVSVLRFFVMSQRYNIVDKIANSLSARGVVEALYEALRTVESLKANAIQVETDYGVRECCEYGKVSESETPPRALKARHKELGEVWCIPCPYLPKEDEVNEFINIVLQGHEGLECAKIVATRAYTYPITREGGE